MTAAPVSAERLAAAARAQTGMPGARVFDVRRAWEDRLPDLWGVTVEGPDRRSNAFFRVADGRVAVPAGLTHAARELGELRPLDGQPWGGGLIYIVTAAGGATPGFPDSWRADEAPRRRLRPIERLEAVRVDPVGVEYRAHLVEQALYRIEYGMFA